jgi:hypothetical protein
VPEFDQLMPEIDREPTAQSSEQILRGVRPPSHQTQTGKRQGLPSFNATGP